MLQATGSRSWCCEIVVRQLSKLENQLKYKTIVGWRLSWMEGFKTIFFTLNHFWTVFLGSFQSFIGSIHRCTKRLGFQPLERLLRADIFASRRRNKFPPKWGVLQSDEVMNLWAVLKSDVKHSESSGLSWTWIATKPGSKFNIGNFQRLELCRPPHLLWGLGITAGFLELSLTHWAIELSRCGMHRRGFSVPYPLRFAHFLIAWECLPRKRRRSLGDFWFWVFGEICVGPIFPLKKTTQNRLVDLIEADPGDPDPSELSSKGWTWTGAIGLSLGLLLV